MAIFIVALFFSGLVALVPEDARAQGAPQIQVLVESETVALGDSVQVEISATSADAMPSGPQLGAAPGFVVRGQNASPSETHMNVNGNRSSRYTLTVDWTLQAQRLGTFAVGPSSVLVGGARYSTRPVTLRVVPAGKAPPRRARPPPQPQFPFGLSPFDPWRQLMPNWNQGAAPTPPPTPPISLDPKLAVDASRGDVFFLHATIDKTIAVVGEQVTLSVYAYLDESAGIEPELREGHDPTVANFAKQALLADDKDRPRAGEAVVGGRVWRVITLRRWALFPLQTGDLVIGPMSLTAALPRSMAGQTRSSETLQVRVSEPPIAGRPPGYALGDVGRFALAAEVKPRAIEQGGAVSVHVELSGTGNLPATITPPARAGVEWLAPEVHESLGVVGNDSYGGKRSFDFVVRVKRSGEVVLGELALPFWDAAQQRYEIARAPLGSLHVSSSGAPPRDAVDSVSELLPGLPAVRASLESPSVATRHADDSPWFWLLGFAGGPAAFGITRACHAVGVRAVAAWRRRRASPASELRDRLSAARAACSADDPRAADAAVERALQAATVAHRGVSVRNAVGDEVVGRLKAAGVADEVASGLAELLRECETARFAPEAGDIAAARARFTRALGAIRHLERRG